MSHRGRRRAGAWLEVDLGAVEHNAGVLRSMCGPSVKLCGVVKKDAYGTGGVQVAHRLARSGCEMLCVWSADEARRLVEGSVVVPILVLAPVRSLERTDALYRAAVADRLHLCIQDPVQLQDLEQVGRTFGIKLPVHLSLDTGMTRMGLTREQFDAAVQASADWKYLRLAGVYSHLATADEDPAFAEQQRREFDAALTDHAQRLDREVIRHLANSFGVMRGPAMHYDMVRPGLSLLGYGPTLMHDPPADAPALKHAVRWFTRLIHVQRWPAGRPVGYGSTHTLGRNSLLGVASVGYGDGYPAALGRGMPVRVAEPGGDPADAADRSRRWHTCPVLGRVNMDQLVIDLTEVPTDAADDRAWVQTPVELFGTDPDAGTNVPALARGAGTHPYDLLCRVNAALPRRYVG